MTTYGDGLFQYGGEPVGGSRFTNPWATVYFVDGDNGTAGAKGTKPDKAMSTISGAISLAGKQDIIYVRPRIMTSDNSDVTKYAEQLTIPETKDHLSIIGVMPGGHGGSNLDYGPKVRWATSGYTIEVYAAAFNMENFCVHKGGSITGCVNLRGITGYVTEGGSCGSTFNNCMFRYGKVYVEGGYYTSISNSTWISASNAYHLGSSAIPSRGHTVQGCKFLADNGAAVANAYVRLLGSSNEFVMRDCYFDQPTGDDEYIYSTGAVDGIIANCYFADDDISWGTTAADEIRVASGTLAVVGCYDDTGGMIANTD